MFLNNGNIAYRSGNDFFEFDFANKQIRELASLKLATKPGKQKEQTYISKEQHKLIEFVALQKRNKDLKRFVDY